MRPGKRWSAHSSFPDACNEAQRSGRQSRTQQKSPRSGSILDILIQTEGLLIDYTYWNAGVSYTWKNVTLDLRYHDTDLNKNACFINTTDPKGVFSGTGRSKWCSEAFIATLSVDFTASQLGIFAPAR